MPYVVESQIANEDRAVGARLAGEMALLRAQADLPADVTFNLNGTAGQSFGAFAVEGMKLSSDGAGERFCRQGAVGWRDW